MSFEFLEPDIGDYNGICPRCRSKLIFWHDMRCKTCDRRTILWCPTCAKHLRLKI